MLFGHLVYVSGLLVLGSLVVGVTGSGSRIRFSSALEVLGVVAVLGFLFLIWVIRYRRAPLEPWFVSHLVRVSLTYVLLLTAAAVGALLFAVGLLLVLAVPPLAAVVIYGPMVGGGLVMVWFAWRMVTGYAAYWRGQAVGDRFPEAASTPTRSTSGPG